MTVTPARVKSAAGAANYYAKDNYYTEGAQGPSEWGGKGAEALGLSGPVTAERFEQILLGRLADGVAIPAGAKGHRAGDDLTFSAPKSVSLVALIGGDQRVIEAHARAVRSTMAWVEERFATARLGRGGTEHVGTGNLVYAIFQHDLSRKLDPQLHSHVPIANATRTADGRWRAVESNPFWANSALIGAAYHAQFRAELAQIGYQTQITGKHGQFDIVGLQRSTIEAFSERALQIRLKAAELGITGPKGLGAVAERTRDKKGKGDAETARELWAEKARMHGPEIDRVVAAALVATRPRGLVERVRAWGEALLTRVTHAMGPRPEPLMAGTEPATRTAPLADAYAVAAGVRHLSERYATFRPTDLLRAALSMAGHGATVRGIEGRIDRLVATRTLVRAEVRTGVKETTWLTTRDIIETEKAIVAAEVRARGKGEPLMPAPEAAKALQAAAHAQGFALADEQVRAGVATLSGTDGVQLIQGDAGTGKSTLFTFVREIAEGKGVEVVGLVPQNKLIDDLESTGIAFRSVESVLSRHAALIERASPDAVARARTEFGGKLVIVDEAFMLSSRQAVGLLKIAEWAGVAKLNFVGDEKQLEPVEGGRPVSLLMALGAPTERLTENRRQRPDDLRQAVEAAKTGDAHATIAILGERVREAENPALAAAQHYLSLTDDERSRTAILTSGHVLRHMVLDQVRSGLVEQGRLSAEAVVLPVLQNLNLTREQMRHLFSYTEGQVLDVLRYERGLTRGSYEVVRVDASTGLIHLEQDVREVALDPSSFHPAGKGLSLSTPAEIEVRAGDRLMWTIDNKARGMVNGAGVEVKSVENGVVTLDDKGREHRLEPGDPALQRLDHRAVLNMHRAQGITVDNAITVMSSEDRLLNSRSLLYVLTSRARDDLTLYTDDKENLAERIADHDGAPPHAHAHDLARERPGAEDAVLDPHAGELEKPEADTSALDAALARFESSLAPKTPEPSTMPAAAKEPEVTRERPEPELDGSDFELDDDWGL